MRALRARLWRWRWPLGVGAATALGLGIRIGTVVGRPNRPPAGDPYSYHYGANLLVEGHGFISPWLYLAPGHAQVQSASYPPLFMLLLAMTSVVGFKSFFAHRIWASVLGSLAIPLGAYTGREISGRRVGMVTALVVAVYPNFWMNDELAMSESISPVLAGLVILTAYRFWRRPDLRRAAALGGAIGLAALGRDEMALLALLVLPLALLARAVPLRRRFGMIGVAAAASVVLVGPWVGYNMARFAKPTFISTGLGVTLASANCATTYTGVNAGYWSYPCANAVPGLRRGEDQSLVSAASESWALRFVRAHESELPRLELEREGRAFAFFRPYQQVQLDSLIETRPLHWAELGLGMYYLFVALSIPGIVSLRRRGIPIYPMVAIGLDVVVAVALTFGQTRYRSTFELPLVLTAAVGIDATVRAAARRLGKGPGADAPEDPPPLPDLEPALAASVPG